MQPLEKQRTRKTNFSERFVGQLHNTLRKEQWLQLQSAELGRNKLSSSVFLEGLQKNSPR